MLILFQICVEKRNNVDRDFIVNIIIIVGCFYQLFFEFNGYDKDLMKYWLNVLV